MVKNLLFDLGGVIMDIEKERCIASFIRLGLPDAESFFGEYSQKGPFLRLEGGDISVDQFHDLIRNEIPAAVSDIEIDNAFCDFLIGIPKQRLAALRSLRNNYKVFLLSNTNPIMWTSKIKEEFTHEGLSREDYFDGIVTSFEAKSLKPDEKIFRYAAETLDINPAETIFLDDSQRNLDAAEKLGFKTLLVNTGEEFITLLDAKNIR